MREKRGECNPSCTGFTKGVRPPPSPRDKPARPHPPHPTQKFPLRILKAHNRIAISVVIYVSKLYYWNIPVDFTQQKDSETGFLREHSRIDLTNTKSISGLLIYGCVAVLFEESCIVKMCGSINIRQQSL